MTSTRWHKVLVALAVVPALVGVIDAALSRQVDLLMVFALVALPLLALLVMLQWGQPAVSVRRDLAAWLRDRAALTGEPMDAIANRLIASQQSILGEGERDGDHASESDEAIGAKGRTPAKPP